MPSADKTKLLEDTFNVLEVDPDGKKFDKGMGVLQEQQEILVFC